MVYAMASIGFLGFCVWSCLKMAFQYSNILVKNITICWNSLNLGILLITFYSLNINKRITQSARNLAINIKNIYYMKGSSETICDNAYYNLKNFWIYYKQYYPNNINVFDNNYLFWLIGFIEGDGAILSDNKNKKCKLIITQKDYNILYNIQQTLLIGNVYLIYDKNKNIKFGRYIISEKQDIILLYLLLNGNLHFNMKIKYLKKWYDILILHHNIPLFIHTPFKFNINNAWLSGLTDAIGNYNIKIYKNRGVTYIKSVFILDQKNEENILNDISLVLFNKKLAKLKRDSIYRIEISCNNNIKNKKILNYFNKYKLKTTKRKLYEVFLSILDIYINQQPISNIKIEKIRNLKRIMNKYIIENQSVNNSNYS